MVLGIQMSERRTGTAADTRFAHMAMPTPLVHGCDAVGWVAVMPLAGRVHALVGCAVWVDGKAEGGDSWQYVVSWIAVPW